MTDVNWVIRDVVPDDISFIYASWVNCIKHGSDLGICCRPNLFYKGFNLFIDKIITSDTVRILVACLPSDSDVILGFIVASLETVYFMFVKRPFQRNGIATSLYKAAERPKHYIMRTASLIPLDNKLKDMVYIPVTPVVTFT